ncbi:MAG: hypothetical protein MOGMAGMI_01831 [Candidatus Omnitrophica bacterium]|nr:hypothetical protein [Candidatus Omnitrophota bacterium]
MKTNNWVFKKDKRDTKPCTCIYAKNGKRIGICLACFESNVYHKERAAAKARQQLIDEVVEKLKSKKYKSVQIDIRRNIRAYPTAKVPSEANEQARYNQAIDDIITLLQTIRNSK